MCAREGAGSSGRSPPWMLKASFLEDLGKAAGEAVEGAVKAAGGAAAEATVGIKAEEQEELYRKARKGEMNFLDFQKIFTAISRFGGAAKLAEQAKGMFGSQGPPPGADMDAVDQKAKLYEDCIDAMTPEEQANPKLFYAGNAESERLIANVAEKSGRSVSDVQIFLVDFDSMNRCYPKMADGKSMAEAQREVQEEMIREGNAKRIAGMNRAQRKALNKREKRTKRKKSKSKKSEWMDL